MTSIALRRRALAAALMLLCGSVVASDLAHPDHAEFGATLDAPFRARGGQYPVRLDFTYPYANGAVAGAWTLEAIAPDGRVVRQWQGIRTLDGPRGRVELAWDGRDERGQRLPAGYYTLRLRAVPAMDQAEDAARPERERIAVSMAAFADEVIEQDYDVMVGDVRPANGRAMAPLRTARQRDAGPSTTADSSLSTQAIASGSGLPYTIYYGNFHAQTNHSDGGGDLATCTSSQGPQNGAFGPTDAYATMRTQAGGDFLLNSEHNHMYDGSTSTATSASPATAIALFDSGLQAAADYRAAHPSFMALYGLEWGVISNGGHLNIVNADALPNWEYNSSGQLIGEVDTPKSDYPALYATMKARGWIGQFNHPATTGQFLVGGVPLGFDANGADVMVMTEVLNSSAFSTNTTETETSRSSYVGAWNKLLEAGYKVAPSTNQDNHCANWGLSFTNRTGVLLPDSAALDTTTFTDALRARRVFATEDKSGQLVLTGNGRVMGESFANSGPLTLTANFASTTGQTVQRVQFFAGVPGRNGTVAQLAEGSTTHTFTPANGEHFFYALVTQANGLRLWSAPVWVSQGSAPADTVAPTVSASTSGTSGTVTLAATASDNVGVTRVEFLVDGALVGSDTTAPYAIAFDSTTVANGSHSLTARAFDAAGNSATSAGVAFTVDNAAPADTVAPTVSASTAGGSGSITLSASASDNVGVTLVDFYVDGVLRGSDAAAPYAIAFDSTTVADGSHSLTARAFDAAGNSATSAAAAFTVTNTAPAVERLTNGGFEAGKTGWTASNGVITKNTTYAARTGTWKAWLNGYGSANTEFVYQSVAIPAAATSATLGFWLRVASAETTTTTAFDTVKVQLRNGSNAVIATLGTYSNLDKGSTYVQRSFDVSAYRGQTVRVYFEGVEGAQVATSFLLDDVSLQTR
ncbi:Ig-like domain-containing protein [Cognatilysobacter tabacisoli]|uniref:Ig-like domain-containing protein n=1 Tax=Cognatilysobacter tabacisoli TaxID=2315424 RepID=UPI000E6B3AB2|nr:Ig-like domain-containing protein [Lysobacter tabacisoli]